MHSKGYVVAVRHNGQTLKEQNGKIAIPFHAEYEIRLRNKTRKKAVADVYIDGRLTTKSGVIVEPNDFIDLERFIEDDLRHGRRFKFVPLEDGRVQDKGEQDNGLIEVRFYPEKDPEPVAILNHCCHSYYCYSCWLNHCTCQPCRSLGHSESPCVYRYPHQGSPSNEIWTATYSTSGGTLGSSMFVDQFSAGATVEGSSSSQSFGRSYVDVDRINPVIITVQLLGMGSKTEFPGLEERTQLVPHSPAIYCSGCGRQRRDGENFCPTCGKGL